MRYNAILKERVRLLRSRGKTYSEIKRSLNIQIPKSTLSSWCSNVILPKWYEDKVNSLNKKSFSRAQKLAWASNKLKRERLLVALQKKNEVILKKLHDKNTLKMLLAILYLGEGSKWKSHRGLMLGSSDPSIIQLYILLLKSCYKIDAQNLKCRISHRADQDITFLNRYWSRITSIPLKNFYKSKPDPRTEGRPTKRKDYQGVCVISGAGTHIQLELEEIPRIILRGL